MLKKKKNIIVQYYNVDGKTTILLHGVI